MRTSRLIPAIALLLGVAVLFAQDPIPRDELGISPLESLHERVDENLKRHEKLAAEHGSEHPTVKRCESELASLENMRVQQLKKMPSWARRNITAMNDPMFKGSVQPADEPEDSALPLPMVDLPPVSGCPKRSSTE